jgi:hypothetical protein
MKESERYITTDGQSAYDQIFINVRQLRVCWYGALSLTRGRFCRLQLLLVLTSAVILGSESRGTRDHILLPQVRNFPILNGQSPYLCPLGTWWPRYTPRHWVPFLSPPTSRRATVEVFEPVSTRGTLSLWWSSSRSLLPATSRHTHTWHRAPLGPMAIYLFNVKTFFFPFSDPPYL